GHRPFEPAPGNAGVGRVGCFQTHTLSPVTEPLSFPDRRFCFMSRVTSALAWSRRRWLRSTVLVLALSVVASALVGLFAAQALAQETKQRLVVYTYDSLASGPAQIIKEGFEARYPDVEVVFIAPGSSGETLARLIAELDAGGTDADVLIGISDTMLPRALERGVFMPLDRSLLPNLAKVPADLDFDKTGHVVPFDTGYV